MKSKKKNNQKGNNTSSMIVSVNIDYEKLGEAVAKAIVREEAKENEKYSLPREWMKFILYPIMIAIGLGMACLCVFSFYKAIGLIPFFGTSLIGSLQFIGLFALGLFSIALCITTFWTSKEIEAENDRQFVATMFSNITALVALIVAIVALFQELL